MSLVQDSFCGEAPPTPTKELWQVTPSQLGQLGVMHNDVVNCWALAGATERGGRGSTRTQRRESSAASTLEAPAAAVVNFRSSWPAFWRNKLEDSVYKENMFADAHVWCISTPGVSTCLVDQQV